MNWIKLHWNLWHAMKNLKLRESDLKRLEAKQAALRDGGQVIEAAQMEHQINWAKRQVTLAWLNLDALQLSRKKK